jgi:competence protein ComEC
VGQGDAILLEGDHGARILVDGGPDPSVLLARLDGYVPSWDRRLDAVVLTHPHEDHVAGLAAVVRRYRVARAFESGRAGDNPGYVAWKSALAAGGVPVERLNSGQRLSLDHATLEVRWPDDGTARGVGLDPGAAQNRVVNDSSIVLLGEYEGRRFLLTGDAEEDVDPVLLARRLPRVDMLKVAHHGSATATSAALLDALHPAVAVVSVGAENTYGHPNDGTLTRLRTRSRAVDRTDRDGTIEVTLDRTGVTVTTARAGLTASARPPLRAARLLYDSADVSSQPSRQRRAAALARPAGVASPPLPRRGRGRVMARAARVGRRRPARSPPRRICRPPA